MGKSSPIRWQKPRFFAHLALTVAFGLPVSLGLTGCKNAGGTGTASPISFPFSSPGPTATPGATSAGATAGIFTGASAATNERDPLLGLSTSASQPRPITSTPNAQNMPALPNPSGSASPAALTGGTNSALDGTGRNGANPPASAPAIRMDQQPGTSGFAPVTGAGLQQTSMNAGVDEYRQLQNELARRRVVYQRLEMVSENNWRCLVTVPDPTNPAARRNFDVRSNSDMGALRMAILEMDKQGQPATQPGSVTLAAPAPGVAQAGYSVAPLASSVSPIPNNTLTNLAGVPAPLAPTR